MSVFRIKNTDGAEYWRVQLGKRFTGGKRITRNFDVLPDAKDWIFGDAAKHKAAPGSVLELKAKAGAAAFTLSAALISEAYDAFRSLAGTDMTLTEVVDYAIWHSRPDAGVISIEEAIRQAELRKEFKRPAYGGDLVRRCLASGRSDRGERPLDFARDFLSRRRK